MSVIHLDAAALATSAADTVRHSLAKMETITVALSIVSAANVAALAAQHGDDLPPVPPEDIASLAADILAERADRTGYPGLVYNCITNDGAQHLDARLVPVLDRLETDLRAKAAAEEAAFRRREENAVAYDEVPRLPSMETPAVETAMKAAGADRVIYAEFRVNESDGQSDYYGARRTRTVVIGFGRGKRESFSQLRKAAAAFPPTRDYGPGRGRFYAKPVTSADYTEEQTGQRVYAGTVSGWHRDIIAGPLPTRAAAESHAAAHPLAPLNFPNGTAVPLEWRITEDDIEHRENYSMGGGNYLGESRYGGWVVRSTTYTSGPVEVFSTAAFGGKK
jgi:hypothetical protein